MKFKHCLEHDPESIPSDFHYSGVIRPLLELQSGRSPSTVCLCYNKHNPNLVYFTFTNSIINRLFADKGFSVKDGPPSGRIVVMCMDEQICTKCDILEVSRGKNSESVRSSSPGEHSFYSSVTKKKLNKGIKNKTDYFSLKVTNLETAVGSRNHNFSCYVQRFVTK